jgi:exodeoxyribonuclease V alpha subunit
MDTQIDNFDTKQQEAIEACCDVNNRVVAVTGPAGTGKTSIMRAVYQYLNDAGYTVALCAPTGKASKRIREATGIPAMTMHRLLEYSHPGDRDPKTGRPYGESVPKRDRKNPLQFDVVLADEYAMVNQELHRNLLDALPNGGRVCCFGDMNQLPPIERIERLKNMPSPFKTILDNNKLKSVVLETIHRQDEGSGIVKNGVLINSGRVPKRLDDFDMKITDYPTDVLRDYVKAQRELGIDFASIDHQIITVGNKSWIGTAKLNQLLQSVFRPETDGWFELPRHDWIKHKVSIRVGDKVIITQNNYDLRQMQDKFGYDDENDAYFFVQPTEQDQIFNGETGIVTEISEVGEVYINLGDRTVMIPPDLEYKKAVGQDKFITVHFDPRKDIDLAYAVTTHKAQGSEFLHVVYILNRSTKYMQSRSNLYTGITRARKHVCLISDQSSLTHSVWKK